MEKTVKSCVNPLLDKMLRSIFGFEEPKNNREEVNQVALRIKEMAKCQENTLSKQ